MYLLIEKMKMNEDMVVLMKLVRGFCCRHDTNQEQTVVSAITIKSVMYYYPKLDVSNDDYYQQVKTRVKSVYDSGGEKLKKFTCLLE